MAPGPLTNTKSRDTAQTTTGRLEAQDTAEVLTGEPRPKRRRYTALPELSGMMNFNLHDGLSETPYQNSNRRRTKDCASTADDAGGTFFKVPNHEELVNTSAEEHSAFVMAELSAIDETYRPKRHRPSPPTSHCPETFCTDQLPQQLDSTENRIASPSLDNSFSGTISDDDVSHPTPGLLRDLETRAITVSQLIQEVKGIYAGLVMGEKKCIEIVSQQAQNPTKLSKEQWQALIALHRMLLNEHHDFFSATRHHMAPWELRMLASKYAMPLRLLQRNINSALELLKQYAKDTPGRMHDMLDVTFGMLNRLRHEVSPTSPVCEDWNMVAKCLHHYVFGLRHGGVNIPETYPELRSRQLWYKTIDEEDIECLERFSQPFCESVEDCNLQPLSRTPSPSEEQGEEDSFHDLPYEFDGLLWAFMAGWYEIGSKIAKNARDFYKVFTFLLWAALSML